jgi:hypothetical protein
MTMPFSWMSNPQYLAQVAHVLAGALFVFAGGVLFGAVGWAMIAGAVAAAFKEFVFDTASWGEGDSWSDSAMDFAFYVIGGFLGLLLYAGAVRGHVLVHS